MSARRAARGRDEVLTGASRVIARRGADATRFADVAAETGSAISTLQYSFGNREDMIIAALRHTNAAEVDRVQTALRGLDDPVERLRTFVRVAVRADATRERARESWLAWVEYWRSGAHDAELAQEWCAVYDQWKAIVLPIVEDGRAAGVFGGEQPADDLVTVLIALFDGLCVPMVLGHSSMPPHRAAALICATAAHLLECPALASDPPPA